MLWMNQQLMVILLIWVCIFVYDQHLIHNFDQRMKINSFFKFTWYMIFLHDMEKSGLKKHAKKKQMVCPFFFHIIITQPTTVMHFSKHSKIWPSTILRLFFLLIPVIRLRNRIKKGQFIGSCKKQYDRGRESLMLVYFGKTSRYKHTRDYHYKDTAKL